MKNDYSKISEENEKNFRTIQEAPKDIDENFETSLENNLIKYQESIKKDSNQNEQIKNTKRSNQEKIEKEGYNYLSIFIVIICLFIAIFYLILSRNKNKNPKKNVPIILDDGESEYFLEDIVEKISKETYEVIISIDFGSSYSGFAVGYSKNTIEAKPENIQPTTIIIKRDNLKGY